MEYIDGSTLKEHCENKTSFFKTTNEDPQPLKENRRDVPESMERIVMRALEKDPAKRYQTGLQLASELSASFDHLRFLDEDKHIGHRPDVHQHTASFLQSLFQYPDSAPEPHQYDIAPRILLFILIYPASSIQSRLVGIRLKQGNIYFINSSV